MRYFFTFFLFLTSLRAAEQERRPFSTSINVILTTNITVEAGESQTIPGPFSHAVLEATVSSTYPHDNIVTSWEFTEIAAPATLAKKYGTTNLASFNYPGRYTIRVRSQLDNYYAEDSLFVFITDQNITNYYPTIDLVSPVNGSEFIAPANLLLFADAHDKDGFITRVVWFSGSTPIWTNLAEPYVFTITNIAPTNYTFSALVEDNDGASVLSLAHTVTVRPSIDPLPNVPPSLTITSPGNGLTFTNPVSLSFTATASDSDGTISSVAFALNGIVTLIDSEEPYGTTISPPVGTNVLLAIATDSGGETTLRTNTVFVINPVIPNMTPTVNITSPTNSQTFTNPAIFTIAASAIDTDGTISKVEFFKNGISLGQDVVAPYTLSSGSLGVGAYILHCLATDDDGAVGISTNVTINVVPAPGIPPVVTLTAPTNGQTFLQGSTITLSATATDSDGSVTNVDWFSYVPPSAPDPEGTNPPVTTLIAGDISSPYSQPWNPVINTYNLYAVARDNSGLASTTAVHTVTIRIPIPPTVNLTLPTNGQQFSQGATISLAATVIDPDTLATNGVAFYQFGTILISTDTTVPYTASLLASSAGNYSLVAKVTYGGTNIATSPAINITVVPTPPQNIYVDAGISKTATLSGYRDFVDSEKVVNGAEFNRLAGSTDGHEKYFFQYIWDSYRDMYLATLETNYINQALLWGEAAVASAGIIDVNGNKNWSGTWASPYSPTPISFEQQDIQGAGGISTVFKTIFSDPDLRAVYGARALVLYNFCRDQIVNKILVVRGSLGWYQNFLHNPAATSTDKTQLMLRILLDLKACSTILGNTDNATKGYPALVAEFAGGIKDYNGVEPCFTPWSFPAGSTNSGIIWQKGKIWQAGTLCWDTSHYNRIPITLTHCYEAGQTFDISYINSTADILTKIVWDRSTTNPQFLNFVDGGNGPLTAGEPPYSLGIIYSGWPTLGKYSTNIIQVCKYTLAAIRAGMHNPSLNPMNTLYGRTALAAHIARAVTFRGSPPYAILDGVVQGSGIVSTNWTHVSGPSGFRILKTNSPITTVTFTTNGIGNHTFRLTAATSTNSLSDDVTVSVAAPAL